MSISKEKFIDMCNISGNLSWVQVLLHSSSKLFWKSIPEKYDAGYLTPDFTSSS